MLLQYGISCGFACFLAVLPIAHRNVGGGDVVGPFWPTLQTLLVCRFGAHVSFLRVVCRAGRRRLRRYRCLVRRDVTAKYALLFLAARSLPLRLCAQSRPECVITWPAGSLCQHARGKISNKPLNLLCGKTIF